MAEKARQGLWLALSITILISGTHFEERTEEGCAVRVGFFVVVGGVFFFLEGEEFVKNLLAGNIRHDIGVLLAK